MKELILIGSIVLGAVLLYSICAFLDSDIYRCYKECRRKKHLSDLRHDVDQAFDGTSSLVKEYEKEHIYNYVKTLEQRLDKLEGDKNGRK